tara:strand:+ start:47 stop:295 length:249 start_codon:yes stop_codon:yes gene_type:complete
MDIALIIVIGIGLLLTWEIVKYSHQQKRINERNNKQDFNKVIQKKEKPKYRTKISKAKVQYKDKPKRTRKKKKKPAKLKTNG